MKPVFVINGPNLNMLGLREPDVYGHETLAGLEERCRTKAKALGLDISFRQSNLEGEIVTWIQEARSAASGLVLNAGAYTHTSVAIHDALRIAELPLIEVHLTNIYKREPFRHHSYVSSVANGVLCGFGGHGYELALDAIHRILTVKKG
ncbi:type II 3-dehydroquinate dehydratase [Taklimakanibacter albus]|uniref:Type II 3-dehydroquinate dehydratase n=1 Tax=Taklimakanibacter albus TaxID=2800327 RepID=A0ACC5R0L0_9HYPH|nr:type II 3-dehydroquinate dehydratase [Aestuariivirga sp. YIM B02566]MBK1866130.1 type II 3-dehydroquinate dehydratase [Aestuariivirga sp. YIM B02566]